jgi:hypothetical protein
MIRNSLIFGAGAGVIVVLPMFLIPADAGWDTLWTGYLIMILAFSLIFVGVKRYRDRVLGGVIRFFPALLVGLGISVVAGVLYVIGWEVSLRTTHFAFVNDYSHAMIEAARAKGASAARLAQVSAEMAAFKAQYADPLYRLPMTFMEIFPVGALISLIAAGLLRNSRFLPARAVAACRLLAGTALLGR